MNLGGGGGNPGGLGAAESLQKNNLSVMSVPDECEVGDECGEFVVQNTKSQVVINTPLISNLHSNY